MSVEVKLKVKAKIDPEAAEELTKFVRAWEGEAKLDEVPEEEYLKCAYENLEHVFSGDRRPRLLEELEDDFLDLNAEFKTNGEDVETFLNGFLSECVHTFIGGSVHYLGVDDEPKMIGHDKKTNRFVLP